MTTAEEARRDGGAARRRGGLGRRRPRRRVQADNAAVQGLFEVSRAIFKGPGTVPPPKDVNAMRLVLDRMKPEDFGLSVDLDFFKGTIPVKGNTTITCTTVYKCDNFSFCLFFLPPTAIIPLHNHPGMTVFTKLLVGTMHITSYDWDDPDLSKEASPSNFRLARRVVDSDFTAPCKACTLYPSSGGNIHTFRAITPCIVLDVMGPPYSNEDDRDCTYYKDHPISNISVGPAKEEVGEGEHDVRRLSWLEETTVPEELNMVAIEYLGPQIVDG